MMRNKLFLIRHWFRANYHWNRMIAILDGTQQSVSHLTVFNNSFADSRIKYNESIEVLSSAGVYRRAVDLIPRNLSRT